MKGIIALDIDGTVTAVAHHIDPIVIDWLHHLNEEGWSLIFITGRPFQWGCSTLEPLKFPYALAVQNGSLLLEMPKKKIIGRKYLNKELIPVIENLCKNLGTSFVIYSGLENEDRCYYSPADFSSEWLSYMQKRTQFLGEKWEALPSLTHFPLSFFSSIKFFAEEQKARFISEQLEALGLHAPPNRDPYNPQFFVIQGTHSEATKGEVLKEFIHLNQGLGPVIAAGDDHNDRSMLEIADVKVVMENAPVHLLQLADIIAPLAENHGIIQGLKEAIDFLQSRKKR